MIIKFVTVWLPWILSAITIWMTILAGNLHRHAWFVGCINQMLWLAWIVVTKNWGFLPMNITLWVIYMRNHFKWVRDVDSRFG